LEIKTLSIFLNRKVERVFHLGKTSVNAAAIREDADQIGGKSVFAPFLLRQRPSETLLKTNEATVR
jgi:hypothetical protein